MLRNSLCPLVAAVMLVGHASLGVAANELVEDFDDGLLHSQLEIATYPGFHVDLANSRAEFSKDAGQLGYGSARINSRFRLAGDFDVSVRVGRNSPTVLGLATYFSDGAFDEADGFADVYFVGGGAIAFGVANNYYAEIQSASPIAIFRLTRQGDSISGFADYGSGYQLIASQSGPELSGPVRVSMFLGEEFSSPDATSGWFDDLTIDGTVLVPEPNSMILAVTGLVCFVRWRTARFGETP